MNENNENKDVVLNTESTNNESVNTESVNNDVNAETANVVNNEEINQTPQVAPEENILKVEENPAPVQQDNTVVAEQTPVENIAPRVEMQGDSIPESEKQPVNEVAESDNNKGPSTFAKIMTVLLFAALFAFVYFLGDITEYINNRQQEAKNLEIQNGRLICNIDKTTDNLNVTINAVFKFESKGIVSLEYTTTSTGDKVKDKEELSELNNNCKILKEEVANSNGVKVACNLNNGVSTVKQDFDYSKINTDEITSIYAEAGGVYPNFKYKDDINSVESKMIASDYTCEKVSS